MQEKFEHLKEMVMLETGIDCTFSPQINQKARKIKSDKPAHDRLYEKGLEYQKLRQEREKVANYIKYITRTLMIILGVHEEHVPT